MPSLGIFTVATNKYINYWQEMVQSFDHHVGKSWDCTFYVFTDNPLKAQNFQKSLANGSTVKSIGIDNLGWPDATILRFELIESIVQNCTEDVLMHLDADMLVHSNFDKQFAPEAWDSGVFLVAHPGFFWRYLQTLKKQNFIKRAFSKIKRYLPINLIIHPLGAWENRIESQAYVDPQSRIVYVCGATWGGKNSNFKELVSQLSNQTRTDRENKIMAVWHDESHLNKWASENNFQLLNPNYCYAEQFSNNSSLEKIIQAVDKGENSTRE